MEKTRILRTIYKGLFAIQKAMKEQGKNQGACGGTPKRDGSGKGIGNKEKKAEIPEKKTSQEKLEGVVDKTVLPVGSIRDRKDGKYKKVGEGKWVKVSTGKPSEDENETGLSNKEKKEGLEFLKKQPIKELKRRQSLNGQQLKQTANQMAKLDPSGDYKKGKFKTPELKRLNNGIARLQDNERVLASAVDYVEFEKPKKK